MTSNNILSSADIDYDQGKLPVTESIRGEFRDEISPRRLAHATEVFHLIELLGRQWLLDKDHVARLKLYVPDACQKYLDFMYTQLGRERGNIEDDNSINGFALEQQRNLEACAFVDHKEEMFQFLVVEFGNKSWRTLGECLRMSKEFLDTVEHNYSGNDARILAVLRNYVNVDDEWCMHNSIRNVLCRLDLGVVEERMGDMLREFIKTDDTKPGVKTIGL